jgi:putative transposase
MNDPVEHDRGADSLPANSRRASPRARARISHQGSREIGAHHSDQGVQYASIAFGIRCRAARVRPSMGSVGDAYDNAMAESFFATLETELLARRGVAGAAETRMAVFEWIEGWYNSRRRHSALGYLSPNDFEKQRAEEALTTASP